MIPLLLDNLRGRRIALVALLGGLLAISIGYLSIFPQLEEQLAAFAGDMPEFYDALIGDADFATPEGYVRTQVYALVAPLLASGVCISVGAGMARSERDVTLTDAYLAPVSRATLALSHLATTWGVGLAAGLGVLIGVTVGAPMAGADVPFSGIAAATLAFVGVTWAAGAVSWAVGAATGAPGAATGAGWGFIAFAFLSNSVGEVVADLDWLVDVSPWGWYGAGAPVTDGFEPMSLLLFVVAFVLVPVGLTLFERRDLQL